MVFQPNNIRDQQAIIILDVMKSIQLLNNIYIYVKQDIHCVDNENYVIYLIHGYDFYNTLLLNMIFIIQIILVLSHNVRFHKQWPKELI